MHHECLPLHVCSKIPPTKLDRACAGDDGPEGALSGLFDVSIMSPSTTKQLSPSSLKPLFYLIINLEVRISETGSICMQRRSDGKLTIYHVPSQTIPSPHFCSCYLHRSMASHHTLLLCSQLDLQGP